MQRRIVVFFGVVLVCLKYSSAQLDGSTLYSRRYEKLDVDTILRSPRLVTNYVECLLNKKPCPPEGKALKRILPEALRTKCGRCWPSQKEGALKVITELYFSYPQHYNALKEKWDPTGEYHRRLMEYLRDQKFNVINSNGDEDYNGDQQRIPAAAQTTQFVFQPAPSTTRPPVSSSTFRPQFTAVTPVRTEPQRPTRQDEITQVAQDGVSEIIGNRFGDDVDEFEDSAPVRTQSPRTPKSTPQPAIVNTTPSQGVFVSTQFQSQNPILNIINRLSMKFSNTAELIASVIRGVKQALYG